MFRKSLLILAIAACCASAQAQTPSSPAKKELVARILKLQQPSIEALARNLVEQPAADMLDRAGAALPQRVPEAKRETVAKDIQADARKYVDDTVPMVRDRALKLAPTTVGSLLEEKFTEDELKQIATIMESPVFAKFQSLGGEMQKALIEKLVADTRGQVEPKVRALEDSIAKRLGLPAEGGAPAAAAKPPAKKK
jgi:hypothetical protein